MSDLSAALFPRRNARHARPAAAPKILVAGGMTAALGLADAALLSSPASAGGTVGQFEQLAQCESGGNWAINTGNGYYGGIQFNLATWRGLGFGGYPHQASKATQIAAGQKLHSQRGWQPWPSCSRKLGLRGDGGYSGSGTAPVRTSSTSTAPAPTKASVRTAAERRAAAQRASRTRATRVAAQKAQQAARAAAAQKAAQLAAQQAAARLAAAKVAAVRLHTGLLREQMLVPMPGATGAALAAPTLAAPTTPQFDGHVITVADRQVQLPSVEAWQRQMDSRGWDLQIDGHFGPQSARVAALFAREKGAATPAGTVDAQLWDLAWTAPVTP